MAPDNEVVAFVKDFVWAPCLLLVGWAWKHNEQAHKDLKDANAATKAAHDALKEATASGHSTLNDKFMEHIDHRMESTLKLMREGDVRNSDHVAKLYDKVEETRRDTANALAQHAQRSEDRHRELMTALHTGLAQKADK